MSGRIEKSWVVLESIENDAHDRCVDLFLRPDGSFGFEEFRRDVEDAGAWTPVAYHSSPPIPRQRPPWAPLARQWHGCGRPHFARRQADLGASEPGLSSPPPRGSLPIEQAPSA
jgi:hypothetical protein